MFYFVVIIYWFGDYQFIQAYPSFLTYLAFGGSLYIAYMGYKIAISKPEIDVKEQQAPKFYEGFALQWINPKAGFACVFRGVSIFSKSR